jgi:hypothetical protein
MLALLISALSALTLDDFAIGILASVNCLESRIFPMARTWYRFVPRVDIYIERNLSTSEINTTRQQLRANLSFHAQVIEPHVYYGTAMETAWDWAQGRHLAAMSDLWERYPNKSFYFICDDDTFVLPSNLLRFANTVDSEELAIYGKVFFAYPAASTFSHLSDMVITHGGSGQLISGGLMRVIGPRLRFCAEAFAIAHCASDIRLAICVARTKVNGEILSNDLIHQQAFGFNGDVPDQDIDQLPVVAQISFHRVIDENAYELFDHMLTIFDDAYYDWSSIAFRVIRFDSGGFHRSYFAVFGHLIILTRPRGSRLFALGGIKRKVSEFADFVQEYESDFQLLIRCNDKMKDGELGYFGDPPPPLFGVIVELNCPVLSHFPAMNGTLEFTYEEESFL